MRRFSNGCGTMPEINPEILIWARETAGFTAEEAAKKLGLQNSRFSSGAEKLETLESGEKAPTRPQLLKMAEQYRRPLLTFYLSRPPTKGDRGADFRTLPGDHATTDDALLDALLRDARARQSMVRAVLEDEEEAEPLAFVGSHRVADGPEAVLASLKKLLGVELHEYRNQSTPSAAFELLRDQAERAGIFVMLKGDLGNYLTAIDTTIFRGFCIADEVAPFVVINDQDARAAWSFTLLHEAVHILLGETGVGSERIDSENERFCNDVAGNFLLPSTELERLGLSKSDDLSTVSMRIGVFANDLKVSRTMVAYNAYRSNFITQEAYGQLSTSYRQDWRRERERSRARAREQEGGPNYYTIRRHRLGGRLIKLVERMRTTGALSTSKAARILGVKSRQVQPLLDTGRHIRR